MTKPRLTLLGVQLESEAYPNVLHRVRALENCGEIQVSKIHHSGWRQQTQVRSGKSRILRNFWRMFYAHLLVFVRYLRSESTQSTYIPYPATLLLWLLSFFPAKTRRTRLVADAFISLFDTIVVDRKLFSEAGLAAKLLYAVERRAFQCADAVIVDTAMSASYMAALFRLPADKFVPAPLATDETRFQPLPYQASGDGCRVLFIGTLIPLHGMQVIVDAAAVLQQRRDIQLRIIGDGQDNSALAAYVATYVATTGNNIEWLREWQDSQRIATEIAAADICLGIFGGSDKTQRVLPFKLYAYSRLGRCIITAATDCTRGYTDKLDFSPWYQVPVADGQALAAAITRLADDTPLRATLAGNAARFYAEYLSNEIAEQIVMQTLFPD